PALYSGYCSVRKVGVPKSKATATWVGCCSRIIANNMLTKPYTALVCWPVVVWKFSAGNAKKAQYAMEWPSMTISVFGAESDAVCFEAVTLSSLTSTTLGRRFYPQLSF